MNNEADYIVVGGGSAGCIIAARLSEDPSVRVDLIEAGEEDRNPWIHIPSGYAKLMAAGHHFWKYATEAEPHLHGRSINWPRGKVLGGSGSINGLVFLRGAPLDYDGWEQDGATGWSWRDVVPYFRRLEDWQGAEGDTRGKGGPVPVTQARRVSTGAAAFIDACESLGFRRHRDVNDGTIEGVSTVQTNVRNGRRYSTARAYLHPARNRRNLRVVTNATVQRIVIENKRATGVVVRRKGAAGEQVYRARREVILCGGAIGSPQLLMLSGIGDADDLARLGIPAVHHAPGVGRNLQDHLLVRFRFRARPAGTLNEVTNSRLRLGLTALGYAMRRDGPLASGPTEAVLFARSSPAEPEADVQIQYINFCIAGTPSYQLPAHPGFMLNFNQCRPESRGELLLRSRHSSDAPLIRANYLSAFRDRQVNLAAAKLARRIGRAGPFGDLVEEELAPPPGADSDEALLDYIRSVGTTVFHPCGTCRMGKDAKAVVDPALRVQGVEGLRVADASVMPRIPSSNIHAGVLMVAERAAAIIREQAAGSPIVVEEGVLSCQ